MAIFFFCEDINNLTAERLKFFVCKKSLTICTQTKSLFVTFHWKELEFNFVQPQHELGHIGKRYLTHLGQTSGKRYLKCTLFSISPTYYHISCIWAGSAVTWSEHRLSCIEDLRRIFRLRQIELNDATEIQTQNNEKAFCLQWLSYFISIRNEFCGFNPSASFKLQRRSTLSTWVQPLLGCQKLQFFPINEKVATRTMPQCKWGNSRWHSDLSDYASGNVISNSYTGLAKCFNLYCPHVKI